MVISFTIFVINSFTVSLFSISLRNFPWPDLCALEATVQASILRLQLISIRLMCIPQVARSRISDVRVWKRARDYLGLMSEPAISLSVLGPSRPSPGLGQNPGTVKWSDGATKMIAHIPFYILGEQEGINTFFSIISFLFLNSLLT